VLSFDAMSKQSEVRIVPSGELDRQTAQTPGMQRRAAIDRSSVGSEKLWVGVVTVEPGTSTGAHHHGDCDSVVCITEGSITIRWGTRLEKRASAAAGDFIYIPARLVHQEINESDSVPVSSIVVRSGDNVVENVVTSDQLADAERGR
jgi:uncharacterized RmlC-like cupin family protein